jgi:glycosyltransferase involved in cell wall biosynthesis
MQQGHEADGTVRVAVLLATYDGAPFLDAQLESLAAQTHPHLDIWVSDDGSTDGGLAKLEAWSSRWSKGTFRILDGPRQGFARNFAALVGNGDIVADCFAYCDQDDVWDPDKIERATAWLGDCDAPRVYCGRTRLIDRDGRVLGQSPLFRHAPSFRNAITQSIAGGNTMVLNHAARDLMAEAMRRTDFVAHDWWTYMVVTGAGGTLHYDPRPAISYRQHGGNAIGANEGWPARIDRLRRMFEGRYRSWNRTNLAGLRACEDLLTPQARGILATYEKARRGLLPARLLNLARSRAFRQTRLGQAGLYLACAVNRL